MTFSTKALLLALLLTALPVGLGMAQQQNNQAVENKSQAADKARKAVNGRVLKVDKRSKAYRVKVLKKSGRVVSVDVDKQSGQVKSDQKEDDKG